VNQGSTRKSCDEEKRDDCTHAKLLKRLKTRRGFCCSRRKCSRRGWQAIIPRLDRRGSGRALRAFRGLSCSIRGMNKDEIRDFGGACFVQDAGLCCCSFRGLSCSIHGKPKARTECILSLDFSMG
jgi:hypothetical protein